MSTDWKWKYIHSGSDDVWSMPPCRTMKSYNSSVGKNKGQRRHLIDLNYEVSEWLNDEYPQFGIKNPEWFITKWGEYNVSDKMLTLIQLKWQ